MNIIIRADASTQMGSGHVMRCLTLATELVKNGAVVEFICREHEGNLIELIRDQGFIVTPLKVSAVTADDLRLGTQHAKWLGASWQEDAQGVVEALEKKQVDWLIVDHYGLDYRWEKQLKFSVKKIMVIDDLADRKHDCELLLDQNFYLKKDRYHGLVSNNCVQCLGPKYALLRDEFREVRKNLRERDGQIKKILVFFGGSDSTNETGKALDAFSQLENRKIKVDVIIGLANPHRASLEKQIKDIPSATLHVQVDNMAERMAEADLMIGAGGSTTWERCCLGLPCLTVAIAENQEQLAKDLADQGYVFYLGRSTEVNYSNILNHLKCLVENYRLTAFVSEHARKLVDAQGIKKIVQKLSTPKIKIRSACETDCENIFNWRNSDETRKYIFDPRKISWENHCNWFQSSLKNTNRHLLIGEVNQTPVGVLRYDFNEEEAVISIYLVPGLSNKGLGTALIRTGNQWIQAHFPNIKKVLAEVFTSNYGSQKAFENVGFKVKCSTLQYDFIN